MLWRRWCVGQCQKEITDIRQGVRTFHQGAALIFDCQKQTWGKNFILWYGYFLCDFFSNSKANNFSFSTWKYFVCMLKNVIQLFSMIFTKVWEITLSIRVLRRFFFLPMQECTPKIGIFACTCPASMGRTTLFLWLQRTSLFLYHRWMMKPSLWTHW